MITFTGSSGISLHFECTGLKSNDEVMVYQWPFVLPKEVNLLLINQTELLRS